ncbi:hypothetical protein C8J57DRAFT_1507096 [Mycena rebaudengoi]|nr:hypothetical protein C8J57DRAFT_1507096 [Mycena rebaudengoi]
MAHSSARIQRSHGYAGTGLRTPLGPPHLLHSDTGEELQLRAVSPLSACTPLTPPVPPRAHSTSAALHAAALVLQFFLLPLVFYPCRAGPTSLLPPAHRCTRASLYSMAYLADPTNAAGPSLSARSGPPAGRASASLSLFSMTASLPLACHAAPRMPAFAPLIFFTRVGAFPCRALRLVNPFQSAPPSQSNYPFRADDLFSRRGRGAAFLYLFSFSIPFAAAPFGSPLRDADPSFFFRDMRGLIPYRMGNARVSWNGRYAC